MECQWRVENKVKIAQCQIGSNQRPFVFGLSFVHVFWKYVCVYCTPTSNQYVVIRPTL